MELKNWGFRYDWIQKPQNNIIRFHLSPLSLHGHSPDKMFLGR